MAGGRPLVLLSNDDGYTSPGLAALAEATRAWADTVIVAPEGEQSATSHALTLHRALRLRRVRDGVYALDGTPADCVYVALHAKDRVLPRRPDLTLSGINRGLNLGQDAFYSGTVAAAREAALRGIPSIAASAHPAADLADIAELVQRLGRAVLELGTTTPTPLLNVNVPRGWTGAVEATRAGTRIYEELVEFRTDPRGREYLWIGGPGVRHEHDPGSDTHAYDLGTASITPLGLDLTAPAGHDLAVALARTAAATS